MKPSAVILAFNIPGIQQLSGGWAVALGLRVRELLDAESDNQSHGRTQLDADL